MIKSRLIKDILDLLSDGDVNGQSIRDQINYLTEQEFTYTGAGLFVSFVHYDGIEKVKIDIKDLILSGVTIWSSEIRSEAEATVFCKDGLIDYLEIWSRDGVYPRKELETYTLKQEWKGGSGKVINVD
jgi:hypothetical protein